ncbi:hypothetical protein Lal_00034519 [Lupinus albus]|nr:hypothetical protein Lal_00034519 [Lupinus albus]
MFPGMFMRKPDKAAALKQLKSHAAMFGTWVVWFLRMMCFWVQEEFLVGYWFTLYTTTTIDSPPPLTLHFPI